MNDISRALTRNDVRVALAAGLLVGGVSGYLVATRVVAAKFERIANEEIESVKEHYHRQAMLRKEGLYSDPANLVEEKEEPKTEGEEYQQVVTELEYTSGSDLTRKATDDKSEETVERSEVTVTNVFHAPQPSIGQRDPDTPYIITVDEFMNNEEFSFDQITITYFEGDDTLVDEREEIIPDVLRTIGGDTLMRFGEKSNDPNIVYVRNERLRTDFEVVKDQGKYSVMVLGLIEEIPHKPRKNVQNDDERDD